MFHCVFIEYHLMIGVDFHTETLVPGKKEPFEPHLVSARLNWILPASMAESVRATFTHGRVMKRGTDIQSGIPHVPLLGALLDLPPIIAFSGSKSHFGPASVLVDGDPVAVALYATDGINLNCGDVPTPTGHVLAPNTVVTGMTWGDILGGWLALLTDLAIQFVLGKIYGAMSDDSAWAAGFVGMLFGSPLGFSFNANGHGPIGQVGRIASAVSDVMRSCGEEGGAKLAGDKEQAKQAGKNRDAALKKLSDEGTLNNKDWHLYKGQDGNDKDGDWDVLRKSSLNPANWPFVSAIDNPLAEQF